MTCLFCQIADKKIPATIRYEDNEIVAFDDITPLAPVHKLIIPKKHISNLNELDETDHHLAGKILRVAQTLAKENAIDKSGYRVVVNCNEHAGQTVFHLHFHLLGGKRMGPPG